MLTENITRRVEVETIRKLKHEFVVGLPSR